jgi:hypothetical protein
VDVVAPEIWEPPFYFLVLSLIPYMASIVDGGFLVIL